MTRSSMLKRAAFTAPLVLLPFPLQGADTVIPGAARVDATFNHLGVLWQIDGDDDRDSSMTLEFRPAGSGSWQAAAPAMGGRPELVVNGKPLGTHYWAASALFLESGTTYDLRVTLWDPDGGGEVRVLSGTTRTRLEASSVGVERFVVPGSGGGDGSAVHPFRGLQAAADAAAPGDIFLVRPGRYEAFQISTSGTDALPIVFRGPGGGSAIVDGAGTSRGVVTVGTGGAAPVAFVIIEGLTIENGHWGVDAQHSRNIAIRNNIIRDVGYGVVNRRDADQERNQIICDNVIEGRTIWPGAGIPSERGIDLRGWGNVVCHNRVRNFGDCISVQPSTGPSYGNDVFGNDVAFCVDDGIEIDYNQANARVWRNRVYNAHMGVSVQPIAGGPAYIFRNELFNLEGKTLKLHNSPAGLYVAHNTGVKLGNGVHDTGGSIWRNAVFRNNLFLGTRYAFEFVTVATDGFRDLDSNAWGTTRSGTGAEPHFKWDNVRYDRLSELQAAVGVETTGVEATFADLVHPALPGSWDVAVQPGSRDLSLQDGVVEIDAGEVLPNLNDPFPVHGAPDLGAFERGTPPPPYGPRQEIFRDGFETGNTVAWSSARP